MNTQLFATEFALQNLCDWLASQIGFLALFQNPFTLGTGFNGSDLVEANFGGYGRIPVGGQIVRIPGVGTVINASGPVVIWQKAAGPPNLNVYGVYYLNLTGSQVLWAQAFEGGPQPMVNLTDYIRLQPVIGCSGPLYTDP
jgi:hypothetical protein